MSKSPWKYSKQIDVKFIYLYKCIKLIIYVIIVQKYLFNSLSYSHFIIYFEKCIFITGLYKLESKSGILFVSGYI